MGGESNTVCANGGRDEGFLSQRMRGVGDITQETAGPADIIGPRVSSPSGARAGAGVRRERKERTERKLLPYCGTD